MVNKSEIDLYHQYINMLTQKQIKALLRPIESQAKIEQQQGQERLFSLNISHRQLRKIPPLPPFSQCKITELDVSYNYFKYLKQLQKINHPYLQVLKLAFNFFTQIEGSSFLQFTFLKVLDMSANQIETAELHDKHFPSLQALYLKNNKIKYFIHCPNTVEMLCLDHNKLDRLAFTGGKNLQIVSASSNLIFEIEFEVSEKLLFLDLENNNIKDLGHVQTFLKKCPNILSLNLLNNYVSKIAHKRYLVSVLGICQQILKVDEVRINPHVRQAFKIMAQQENLEKLLDETQEKYKERIEEQLKLKEQLLDEIKMSEEKLESDFVSFMDKQKQQLDALENYAKNNLGKKKYGIEEQNKDLMSKVRDLVQNDEGFNEKPSPMDDFTHTQLRDLLVKNVILQHKNDYENYKYEKRNQPSKNQQAVSQLKKYLSRNGLQQVANENQTDDLNVNEVERRKDNMRNPNVIYRNSNELMRNEESEQSRRQNSRSKIESKQKEEINMEIEDKNVINLKCIPFLIKNYGFHTVV